MIDLGEIAEKLHPDKVLVLFMRRLEMGRVKVRTLVHLSRLSRESDTKHLFDGPRVAIDPHLVESDARATYLRRVRYSIWAFEVR